MAEPAYEQLEEYEVPAGGIADFIVPDEEIEAMDRRDAERAFGNAGIANFKDVAARMADYGRYGDDTVAHLQTGEIVIPAALIADNPALKESIFDDLRARGIEDPERYVVGSPENSINPETGLPEFFLKKLFKGVKKAFKKVGKFLKKAAGVILPIALSFTPLGPVFGAALGSGIASLIQGGSLKDAFKAAAISGATGGILKGIGSAATGGTFTGGVKEAVSGFGGRVAQTASGLGSTVTGGGLTGAGNLFTGYVPTAGAAGAGAAATPPVGSGAAQPPAAANLPPVTEAVPDFVRGAPTGATSSSLDPLGLGFGQATPAVAGAPVAPPPASLAEAVSASQAAQAGGSMDPLGLGFGQATPTVPGAPAAAAPVAAGAAGAGAPPATGTRNLLQRSMDYMVRGGQTPDQVILAQQNAKQKAIQDYLTGAKTAGLDTSSSAIQLKALEAGEAAAKAAGPGLLQRLGPAAALAGAGLYAGGFFETPEQEELTIGYDYTGMDLIRQDPEKYFGPSGSPEPPVYTPISAPSYQYTQLPPQMVGAAGGEVYPRRNGGIMPYEGTPDEDSVRALLMPGEFVMTKDAVRGLGNGSMDRGIKNMYSVMRDLESRGRVA